MSIDSSFFKKERKAGNDTVQMRERERSSINPYDSLYGNSTRKDSKITEQQFEEAALKLQYYQEHFDELTKNATVEQLNHLSYEIAKLKLNISLYEAEQNAEEMRRRKF